MGDALFPEAGTFGLDVEEVDAALDWSPPAAGVPGRLDATVALTLTVTAERQGLAFDLRDLAVTGAQLDGVPVDAAQTEDEVVVAAGRRFGTGQRHRVEIRYGGTPQPVDDGLGLGIRVGWTTTPSGSFTTSEPTGAPTWLVANDHPSDKARYRLAVTVPDALEVLATGLPGGREPGPRPGTTTWRFAPRDPIASYLVSVATGRFDLDEGVAAGTGVPLRSAYPEGTADRYRPAFARTGDMVDLFSRLFGPYPFEVYGVLVVPERLDFAIENQTLSLFDVSTASGDTEGIAAHELAHQWFGDSVSLQRWSDMWLKEGFATYAEALWLEHSRPGYDLDAEMAATWARTATAGPIASPSRADLYGPAVYQRGGLTLHALRRTVGDDDFFAVLRRWTATYRNGNATTEQFVALASEVTGRPLDDFFRSWLTDRRMPALPR